jgi:ABC-type spermidine/putrescine transport system permease subunit II
MTTAVDTQPPTFGHRLGAERGGRERAFLQAGVFFGFLFISLIYIPIAWLCVMSFSARPHSGAPYPLSLEWYEQLFGDQRWVAPLELSLLIGLIVAVCCMIAAALIGRLLPRMTKRGALLLLFLLPLFVPGIVIGAAMFMYFRAFIGVKLGVWSLVAAHFVWAFPFALLAMLVVATRFDTRLLEAAADLGASTWQRFWQIELPLLRPGIIVSGFFGFLLSFNELDRSIYMRAGQITLPLHLWNETVSHQSSVPLVYGLSTIIAVISIGLVTVALWILFFRNRDDI